MKKDHFKLICFWKNAFQILLFIFILPSGNCLAQIKKIWSLGDGEKVFREDQDHPDKNGNYTWDGKTIHLKGLYNEVLAFQVIVETDLQGAKGIELSVDAAVHKTSGKIIGGNTLKYGSGGTIEVFSEHYLHVIDSTPPNWFYGSPAAAPKKMTGWIPDALIPTDALPGKGGFPVDVAPLDTSGLHDRNLSVQNQGFWVDFSLPRDQNNYPSGIYYSSVRLFQMGKLIKEIPVEIALLPQYLPDENHTHVWLFTENIYAYYPALSNMQVDALLKFEGHRHRIDVAGGFDVNKSFFNIESMEKYRPYLNGVAFTPANGYHGNGEGVGENNFPIGMYGAEVMGDTKAEVQKQSDLWVGWFRKYAPAVKYFWYVTDEPNESKYPWIKERTGWIKSNPGIGKYLPLYTTKSYQKELAGAIDIWAGYDGVDLKDLPEVKKSGGDHWFYNGNRPRYGSVILEGTAIDFRVNSWILYKYGINTWFIWNGTHWQHNGQGPKRHLHQNMFQNPLTFINGRLEYGNGDGIVFYPGQMPFYPEENRGLDRIIPTIRLKNIRRGQQDAEIMWMAEKKAGHEKVVSIISRVVPKALSEVSMNDPVPWSQHGSDYDKIREELLKLL